MRTVFADRPAHVLINTVEREFYARVMGREMSWRRGIGVALLEANAAAARECAVSDAPKERVTLKNLKELPTGDLVAEAQPQIHVKLPDQGRPCVYVSFETPVKQRTTIRLPILDAVNQNAAYSDGYSLALTDAPGPRKFWLMLPEEFAGTTLRIDPIGANGPVSKLTIQTGSLPPLATAASQ